jgi:hypothetical protein
MRLRILHVNCFHVVSLVWSGLFVKAGLIGKKQEHFVSRGDDP